MTATRSRTRAWPASAGTDAGALVTSAARLRWRAPELTLLLADRASAAAARTGEEPVRLRAEVLAVFACNQLGRGASAGGRAVRALRATQAAGAQTTERLVRVELAACAADASAPAVALALLQPVLTSKRRIAPTARAAALVAAADGLAKLGGGPEVADLLGAADRLYDASRAVEPDAVLLRRGVVHGRLAAHHRRIGDHAGAEAAARRGLALLNELSDNQLETGQVSGALTFELVLALLELGREAEAVLAAQSLLRRSVRPAGAPAACWLRLALASRVHLPAGRYPLARRLLGDAAFTAERHQLDAVLAECRQLEAQLHERCFEFADALECLRGAQLAERRWRACTAELRTLLAAEFGVPPPAAELRAALAAVVAGLGGAGRVGEGLAAAPASAAPSVRSAPSEVRPAKLGPPLTAAERAAAIRARAAGRHSVLDTSEEAAAHQVSASAGAGEPSGGPSWTSAAAPTAGAASDPQWRPAPDLGRDVKWAASGELAGEPSREPWVGVAADPGGEARPTPVGGSVWDASLAPDGDAVESFESPRLLGAEREPGQSREERAPGSVAQAQPSAARDPQWASPVESGVGAERGPGVEPTAGGERASSVESRPGWHTASAASVGPASTGDPVADSPAAPAVGVEPASGGAGPGAGSPAMPAMGAEPAAAAAGLPGGRPPAVGAESVATHGSAEPSPRMSAGTPPAGDERTAKVEPAARVDEPSGVESAAESRNGSDGGPDTTRAGGAERTEAAEASRAAPVVEPSRFRREPRHVAPPNGLPAGDGERSVPAPRRPVSGRRADQNAGYEPPALNGVAGRPHDGSTGRDGESETRPPVPEQAKPERADSTPAGEQPAGSGRDRADAGDSETGRGPGRHRSDVALADLLAEALVAYENGLRSRMAAAEPTPMTSQAQPESDSEITEPIGLPIQPAFGNHSQHSGRRHAQQPEIPRPRLIDLPRDQVWREPGTF